MGIGGNIIATKPVNPNYKNIEVLLDGKMGYHDYGSGQWVGQESKDLEFIIDLNTVKHITQISADYLYSSGNWIFNPKALEVSFSNDGKTFGTSQEVTMSLNKEIEENTTDLLTIKVNKESRYIKINIKGIGNCPKGHPGAGFPAWFFIDEIIIN